MIPAKTIEELILKHSTLEKDLSSGEIDKKLFAEKSKEYSDVNEIIENAKKYEREINQIRNDLRKSYLEQAEKGEYKFQPGIMYNDLFSSCEKVGDHIINVSEAVAGEI